MDGLSRRLLSRRTLIGLGLGAAAVGIDLSLSEDASALYFSGVTAQVNVSALRVHSNPWTSSTIRGRVYQGDIVRCTLAAGTFMYIRTPLVHGWVGSRYLSLIPSVSIQTIDRGPTNSTRMCMTFDAGSDRGNAAQIMDILAAKQVHASFGMTGNWIGDNPDLVARAINEGHTLINHTLTHRSWTGFSDPNVVTTPAERMTELFVTEQRMISASGKGPRPWFRPPYGDYDDGALNDVAAAGYPYNLMWTVDSLGWNGLAADDIVYRCLTNRGNGYIYLFHVGSQSADVDAIARIIDGLRSHGYKFGTIQRLFGMTASAAGDDALPSIQSAAIASPSSTKSSKRPAPTSTPLPALTPSPMAPTQTSTSAPASPTEAPTGTAVNSPTGTATDTATAVPTEAPTSIATAQPAVVSSPGA